MHHRSIPQQWWKATSHLPEDLEAEPSFKTDLVQLLCCKTAKATDDDLDVRLVGNAALPLKDDFGGLNTFQPNQRANITSSISRIVVQKPDEIICDTFAHICALVNITFLRFPRSCIPICGRTPKAKLLTATTRFSINSSFSAHRMSSSITTCRVASVGLSSLNIEPRMEI